MHEECEHIDGTYDEIDDWGSDVLVCVACDEVVEVIGE